LHAHGGLIITGTTERIPYGFSPESRSPPTEVGDFERFLKKLGYPYMEETGNPAYQLFLG